MRGYLWKAQCTPQLRERDSGLHEAPGPSPLPTSTGQGPSGTSQLQDPVGPNQVPSLKGSIWISKSYVTMLILALLTRKKSTGSLFSHCVP